MNESKFKTIFKRSVVYYGGIAISLNGNTFGGMPDIWMAMPNHKPLLIEAKWLKEVGPTFTRKINYSPLQKNFLLNANSIQNGIAYGLIGFQQGRKITACLVDYSHESITDIYKMYTGYSSINTQREYFDIPKMLVPSFIEDKELINV